MVDFQRARAHMVESQLRAGGVTNARILACMRSIPREDFVDPGRRELAYADDIQWLGNGRFMAAPATLAKLIKLAEITSDDTVLDIGAASGYSTAVIAGLAASVTGLEQDTALAAGATANLAALGLTNAHIVAGDIDQVGQARFDAIIVEGALDSVPDAFLAALNEGGRLVALIRNGAVSVAHVFVKSGRGVTARAEFNAFLPPLVQRPNEEFTF
ncbi:protein-L-isoaspartate O-methyltransferase [Devosia sp.]|uniref:protein-L-isoaspartate O-methyltransferase family protein n=1 Tax=Devosia sp. TaxID=1871048 RepID=UPI00292DCDDA|nr:protein-L-isoaspartate O-methyltransferase [Devosia sp.]